MRTRLSAIMLLVALMGANGLPVLAAQVHPICEAKQHDCGKTPIITKCCCGDQGDSSSQPGPVESRIQLNAGLTPAPCVFTTASSRDLFRPLVTLYISPPRSGPVDLPTLFASLLI